MALRPAVALSALTLAGLPAKRLEEARPIPARRGYGSGWRMTAELAALKPSAIHRLTQPLAPDASNLANYRR